MYSRELSTASSEKTRRFPLQNACAADAFPPKRLRNTFIYFEFERHEKLLADNRFDSRSLSDVRLYVLLFEFQSDETKRRAAC